MDEHHGIPSLGWSSHGRDCVLVTISPPNHLDDREGINPITSLACAFALVGAFIPPTVGSPAWKEWQGLQWYIVPSIGLGTLLIGYAYYFVFHIVIPRRKRQERVWEREPVIVRQFGEVEGEWVQALELVRMGWASRNQPSDQESLNGS